MAGTFGGSSTDPVPNSPLRLGNLCAGRIWAAPNQPLNLSGSPVRAWSRSALSSDLNICKTWGGGKKQESGCLSEAKTALPPKCLKILFNCLRLPRTRISWPWPLSRGSALCGAPALSRWWHSSSSSSPSTPVLASKPALGGGGALQAALTPWEPRQFAAPSHFHADQNLPSPPLLRSWRGFGAALEGLWRGSGEKQRCKGGHCTRLGSPCGSRALCPSPKEETW